VADPSSSDSSPGSLAAIGLGPPAWRWLFSVPPFAQSFPLPGCCGGGFADPRTAVSAAASTEQRAAASGSRSPDYSPSRFRLSGGWGEVPLISVSRLAVLHGTSFLA